MAHTFKRIAPWVAGTVLALILGAVALVLALPRDTEPFRGVHQSGITTAPQRFAFVAAFDMTTTDPEELRTLLKTWTEASEALTQGRSLGSETSSAPPPDTGEILGLPPARLTLTFGAGPSLFDGRFGLTDRRPPALRPLPAFPGDHLNPDWSDGDLVVQAAADDLATAYHALHTLTRKAKGLATARWVQQGFAGPRNLEGFLDGTVNPDRNSPADFEKTVWIGGTDPLAGGTYLVVRRIRMLVEVWDRSSLADQETTVGRDRAKGNPLGAQAEDSHVKLAHGTGTETLFRRPFHYVNGLDGRTGQWDSGLLFLAFMKDPGRQFVPMQTRLSSYDRLNEYIQPVGSAVFVVFPGVGPGQFLGQGLWPVGSLAQRIEGLESVLGTLYPALARGDWPQVRQGADRVRRLWTTLRPEAGDRSPSLEALVQGWAAAVGAPEPDPVSVRKAQAALGQALTAWRDETVPGSPGTGAGLGALKSASSDLARAWNQGGVSGARPAFEAFQRQWALQEALVRNLDPAAYGAIEVETGRVRRALMSASPPVDPGIGRLTGLVDGLKSPTAFGAWDAGLLLFREGLEALLVLAALLAALGQAGQSRSSPWVWGGTAAGLAASGALAFLVVAVAAQWRGVGSPVLVEGLSGLAAVVLMLVVGLWFHRTSAVKGWTRWLKDQTVRGLARPWALGLLAFLAVFREGAETVVFFWGVAASLAPVDLAMGVVGGLAVLAVLGVALIGFSRRLPLGWFFPLATALVYALAVKVLGQSLASLQEAGWVSVSPLGFGGAVGFLGFQPTWETALPQVLLALGLTALVLVPMVGRGRKKTGSPGNLRVARDDQRTRGG